jgi:hypothetical protein
MNPAVDGKKLTEGLIAVRRLREQGIVEDGYNLISPFARPPTHQGVTDEDPRSVHLKT